MPTHPEDQIDARAPGGAVLQKELSFFQAMLDIFSSALESSDSVEREAARQATAKIERIIQNIQAGPVGRPVENARSGNIGPIGR